MLKKISIKLLVFFFISISFSLAESHKPTPEPGAITAGEPEIPYRDILENPTDLELNLTYAKQQEESGNYKLTVATLERLSMLYPSNADIKIYLLSILIKMDSAAKVSLMIQGMLNDPNTSQETKDTVAALLTDTDIQKEKKGKWFAYLDLSYSQTEEDNVDAVSKTGTFYTKDEKADYPADSLGYDKSYVRASSLTLGKNIDPTSSMSLNLGVKINTQNKAKLEESDVSSGSFSYFKVLNNHYLVPYFYYSRPNYRRAKDSNTKGFGFNNTYIINEKHSLNYAGGYSRTKNTNNDRYTTANESNNYTYSTNLKYNYNFTNKNQLSTQVSFTDVRAQDDTNGYDSVGYKLIYSHVLPFGTLKLQSSTSENRYYSKDTFVNSTIDRIDKPFVNAISLRGQINQIIPFAKIINKDNSIFYSLNFKHSDVSSNILNHDTEREFFTMGLTKRINFNELFKN